MQQNCEHLIYGKNKQLVIFDLDPAYKRADLDELLIPTELITLINHYHYPVVYYEALHKHFKEHLAPEVTKDHLRIAVGSQVLPSDLPIGLYLNEEYRLRVIVSEQPCTNGFRILKNSWKKAFCIVNAINGCDYVSKRLQNEQLMEKYRLYCEGKGHNFQHEGNYEGSWIVLRLFIDNQLVERKSEVKSGKTIRDFLFEELPTIYKIGYGVYTHGVTVNLDMSLKELLDYWSYNDGFCYLKIVEGST